MLWLGLARWSVADLAVGVVAAALACWASVALLPPAPRGRRSAVAMLRVVARFWINSLLAGLDVARRALAPRMPLRPGFVSVPLRLQGETPRSAFRALMSLQPGSLPVQEEAGGALLLHCLDTGQPVADSFDVEERLVAKAFGTGMDHG